MTAPSAYTLARPFDDRQTDRGEDWRDDAACAGLPSREYDPFFSEGNVPVSYYDDARRVCADCSVKDACLTDALEKERRGPESDIHGVRGGLTARERLDLLHGKQRPQLCGPKKGTDAGWQRHRRRAQDPCDECRAAHSEAARHYPESHNLRILELAASGMTQAEIARELKVARATVNRTLARLRRTS